jgi:uncharacterized repeat protein (TIGR02543 family)
LTGYGDLTPLASARRVGLIGLLLLLGIAGSALLCGGAFPAQAGAAKCLDCEGEEPGEEAEAQILTIQIQGPGSVATATKTVCENAGGGLKTCEIEVAEGKKVTLSATPASGFTFTGWSGACAGTGACEVTMDEAKSVTATFADKTPPAAPTITSPTAGQVFERTAEEPVEVVFNNSGDSSAVSFLCRVDVASSSGASSCSPPSWSTGNLPAGTHTVYVWAKDAFGNISAPASRSFEVVIAPPKEEGGSGGEEGPPKEEGGSGAGGGTTTPVGTGSQSPPPPPKIAARLVAKSHLEGAKTVFRKLALKLLPAGAKVLATCTGKGCPFKRKQPKVKGGVADLSAFFASRELVPGVLISLKVSAPGMVGQTITLKVRAGKPPKVIKR